MVIKEEEMENVTTEEASPKKSPKGNNDNKKGSELTPPPSKRQRLDPPLSIPQQNNVTALQNALSSVVQNLGSMSQDKIESLAQIIASLTPNGITSSPVSSPAVPAVPMTCDICQLHFTSSSDFYKHLTFNHDFDCSMCLKSFSSGNELETHISTAHNFHCAVCKVAFLDEVGLDHHVSAAHPASNNISKSDTSHNKQDQNSKSNQCALCSESFNSPSELYKHISFKHDLDCTLCHRMFNSSKELEDHRLEEHCHTCCVCSRNNIDKTFGTVEEYDDHIDQYHKHINFYKCINCKKRYVSLSEFQSHVMEVHQPRLSPSPAISHPCKFCKEEFSSETQLFKHITYKHDYDCLFCKETFLCASELDEHVAEDHHSECGVCGVVCRTKFVLLAHYNSAHPEMKLQCCLHEECDEKFLTASEIVSHLKLKHSLKVKTEKRLSPVKKTPPTSPLASPQNDSPDETSSPLSQKMSVSDHMCKLCTDSFDTESQLFKHISLKHDHDCTICQKTFDTPRELDLHIFASHCFVCWVCTERLPSRESLREHLATQHPEHQSTQQDKFTCIICKNIFLSEEELVKHVNVHINSLSSTAYTLCTICNKKFLLASELENHMASVHKDHKLFQCDICTHCFVTDTALHRHIDTYHENVVFYTCNKCSKKSLSKQELDNHIADTHQDDYQYNTCDMCEERFTNQSDLYKHISFVHDNNNALNKCTNCGASFESEKELAEHQLTQHQKSKFFTCKVCGVKFTSYYRLSRHMKIDHKGTEFTCDVCNKTFHSTLALYRHQKTYHEAELNVKICMTCGARLANKEALQVHSQSHTSPKTQEFLCKPCNMIFSSSASFAEHNTFHKRQEYRCFDCGKVFNSSAELKVHVSVDHVGMLMCPHCEEAFQDSAFLEQHIKLCHSTTKSYRCIDCGQCFTKSSDLKVHVTLKHMGALSNTGDGTTLSYNCVDCNETFLDKELLKAHITTQHSGALMCNSCSRVFQSQETLTDHICETLECGQCNKVFTKKRDLEEHTLEHVSTNVNQQYCLQCNNQFNSESEMVGHVCKPGDHNAASEELQRVVDSLTTMVTDIDKEPSSSPPHAPPTVDPTKLPSLVNVGNLPPTTASAADIVNSIISSVMSTCSGRVLNNVNSTTVTTVNTVQNTVNMDVNVTDITVQHKESELVSVNNIKTEECETVDVQKAPPVEEEALCTHCKKVLPSRQALCVHLSACTASSFQRSVNNPKPKPDLKLVHRQLFIAAQNIDVTLLNIEQVETLIQVLASEDGLRQVPQHKVIDLLDAIEKSVKEKEAKEKEARAAKRKLAPAKNPFLSPAQSPKPSSAGPSLAPSPKVPLPTLEPARSTPSPKYLNTPPKQQLGVIIKSSPKSVTQSPKMMSSPKRQPSISDCLPPEVTAAILPALNEEVTDVKLLATICSSIGQSHIKLPHSLAADLTLAVTQSFQILKHPDGTNTATLKEINAIILGVLGVNDKTVLTPDKALRQINSGIVNVLRRNYTTEDLKIHNASPYNVEKFVEHLVNTVIPTLGSISPNLLTLPFLLDLVLKNNRKNAAARSRESTPKLKNN